MKYFNSEKMINALRIKKIETIVRTITNLLLNLSRFGRFNGSEKMLFFWV